MGLGEDEKINTYERSFTIYTEATTNEEYLKYSSDFVNSVEEFQIRAEIQYDKFGLTYKYDQDIKFSTNTAEEYGIKRKLNEKTHELNMSTRFGESSYEWKLEGGLVYNAELPEADEDKEKKLESWKVSLGKELDFIEYAVSYEEKWNSTYQEYNWVWAFKVALTTFPDKGFGLANKYEKAESSTEFEAGI
jgi:hypothetical protein